MNDSAKFPPTSWSMVRAAGDPESADYCAARNRLISSYWKPVFYFLRTKGFPLHRAEDMTQEFFVKMLEKDWIAKADRDRGRFRTYLLTILVRFASDQGSNRAPKQMQFDQQLVAISALIGETDRTFEPPHSETPEDIFMKQWAQAVIDVVHRRLREWCQEKGRLDWFEIFLASNFPPSADDKMTQEQLAARFRITRDMVRYSLDQTNMRFVQMLRAEVADQVDSESEIENEISDLKKLLKN